MDLEHCPTCRRPFSIGPDPEPVHCAAVWPPSAQDVTPVRCRLLEHHRSDEHWHPPLWPRTPDLIWFDDDEAEPAPPPGF